MYLSVSRRTKARLLGRLRRAEFGTEAELLERLLGGGELSCARTTGRLKAASTIMGGFRRRKVVHVRCSRVVEASLGANSVSKREQVPLASRRRTTMGRVRER